jgi:hypothetical protein
MKTLPHKLNIILFITIIFLSFDYSQENEKNIRLLQLGKDHDDIDKGLGPPPGKRDDLDIEREKLENDYQKQLEENNKLKQQIEKNIKYIKILLTTGVIMFSIILFIFIKILINCKKTKSIKKNKNQNQNKNQLQDTNVISSNSSINKSNYNLLDSEKNINISSNNISMSEENNNDLSNKNNNLNENEEIVNNGDCDAPNMANFGNVVINDDNKTLTNNPDVFIPSRMDKILYKPYPKEEIE